MPQTSDARRARWPGYDAEAVAYLQSRGWKLRDDWSWDPPAEWVREQDAMRYLIEEWDYAGWNDPLSDELPPEEPEVNQQGIPYAKEGTYEIEYFDEVKDGEPDKG